MLVKELKNILERYDDDLPVVIKQDEEGVGIFNIEQYDEVLLINGDE